MLRWFLGKPAMIYSPNEYGDSYQKTTALWGNFNTPIKSPIRLSIEAKELCRTNSRPLPEFEGLRRIRNNLVHGIEIPLVEEILEADQRLEAFLPEIQAEFRSKSE